MERVGASGGLPGRGVMQSNALESKLDQQIREEDCQQSELRVHMPVTRLDSFQK